ncbi:pilus assembly protein PilZ [Ralstonia soli]|uniref:Pilus assembly protein PilZ n=1 Tax=Ralstonia soli TaxID=2953896 RepID=A0ABT1AJ66_9RALS|nr:pilus assembly protein PilZ [Ralstonia soli]MCO5398445.1 pilus assembly protein PilZ [Ralstonia soli]
MLNRHARGRGFSIIAVVGALIIISLLMVAALQAVQDQRRRATLSANHALALREAEAALAAAECELAFATGSRDPTGCPAAPDPARAAALNPVTLAGFVEGACGKEKPTQGLCWPRAGQTAQGMSDLLHSTRYATVLLTSTTSARYVIEPIPDVPPSQWMHAGAAPAPHLFRITSAGFSADDGVNVMLQAVYRPRVGQP